MEQNSEEKFQKRIRFISDSLSIEALRLEKILQYFSHEQLKSCIEDLRSYKIEVLGFVESFFQKIEDEILKKQAETLNEFQVEEMTEMLFKKITNGQKEVQVLFASCDEGEEEKIEEYLRERNLEGEIQELRKEVSDYDLALSANQIKIKMNKEALKGLEEQLGRTVFVQRGKNEEEEVEIIHKEEEQIDFKEEPEETHKEDEQNSQGNDEDNALMGEVAEYKPIILSEDWFYPDCERKFLHFFQDGGQTLHLLDLQKGVESDQFRFEEVVLDIEFKIPVHHRSIATREGDIYMIGGLEAESVNSKDLDTVYRYDFHAKKLLQQDKLNHARHSHGVCVMKDWIFVVGGIMNGESSIRCEKLKIGKSEEQMVHQWQVIASLQKPASEMCLTSFGEKEIYKFGGMLNPFEMNNTIEKYDIVEDVWIEVNFSGLGIPMGFTLLSSSACVEINEDEIYLFGGARLESKSNQSFIFRPLEEVPRLEANSETLPYYGTFESSPIVFGEKVYSLQNIQQANPSNKLFVGKRRILCYDGEIWDQIIPDE